MFKLLRLSFVATILAIIVFGVLLQIGAVPPISRIATASSGISIVTSNWYNPQTRKSGGFIGDIGDRLNVVILNGNGFPIRYLNATMSVLQSNTITSLTGSSTVFGDLSSYDQIINSGETTGLNFSVDVSPSASAGLVSISL